MPKVEASDINIYYEIYGKGEPLVMIMGYGGHIGHWFRQIPGLSRECKVIAFDNRGVGRSDKPEGSYSTEMMAGDTAGLLDAIGIEAAHIFGVSMGGLIAQEFALCYPEKVSSLILGCTHSGVANYIKLEKPVGRLLDDFEHIRQITPEEHERELIDVLFSQEFIRNNKDIVEEYIRKVTEYVTPLHGLMGQHGTIMDFDSYSRLPKIEAPTLVICGDADKMISPENSRQIASRIPNAELIMLESIGHGFFLEAVDEANKAIIDFMKRNSNFS